MWLQWLLFIMWRRTGDDVVRMQHFRLTLWTSGRVPSLLPLLSLSLLVTSLGDCDDIQGTEKKHNELIVSDCHLFPFSPPSGGSLSVEKIVSGQNPNFQQRFVTHLEKTNSSAPTISGTDICISMVTIKNNILWPLKQIVSRNRVGGGGSTIGMTPFYRSVPSRVVWSGIAGVGAGAEGGVHAWPAYQMMTKVPGRNILLYAWIFLEALEYFIQLITFTTEQGEGREFGQSSARGCRGWCRTLHCRADDPVSQ